MISKTVWLILVIRFIVVLSYRESFIPTTIRQDLRSSVGAFPLNIVSGGFLRFTIVIVPHHHRRIVNSDANFIKLRNDFQSQIWDPGVSNLGSEYCEIKIQLDCITKTRLPFFLASRTLFLSFLKKLIQSGDGDIISFLWSETPTSLCIYLSIGVIGFKIKIMTLHDDGGDDWFHMAETSALHRRVHRFIYQFYLWYKLKHEQLISRDWYFGFTRINQIQMTSLCLTYIVDSNEIYGGSLIFYQCFDLLKILSNLFEWHQRRWVRELQRLSKEHKGILLTMNWEIIANNWYYCAWRIWHALPIFRRQFSDSFQATIQFFPLSKVMPRAFWSLSYKLIANKKYVKEGHNRLYLLAYKSKNSMVTLHSFIEIVIISFICVNGCFEMSMYLVNTF